MLPPPKPTPKASLKEVIQLGRWVVSVYFSIRPRLSLLLVIINLGNQILGLANIYLFAGIFGEIFKQISSTSPNLYEIYKLLLMLFVNNVLGTLFNFVNSLYRRKLSDISRLELRLLLANKINNLDFASIENPEITNVITRVSENMYNVQTFFLDLISLLGLAVRAIVSLVILLQSSLPIVLLIILVRVPMIFIDNKYRGMLWKFDRDNTEGYRRSNRNANYLDNPPDLSEVRLNNSFTFFAKRFAEFRNWWNKSFFQIRKDWGLRSIAIEIASDAVSLGNYLFNIIRAINKTITVTQAMFLLRIAESTDSTISGLIGNAGELGQQAIRLQEVYDFFQTANTFPDGHLRIPLLTSGPEINIKDLTFVYPNSQKQIFKHLNLTIKPGEKIALVGENGAGKTTLVKLLCRMYKPTSGKILVHNFNLVDIKSSTLYHNMGVLFQEYNNYPQLNVSENISLGRPNRKPNKKRVISAAKHASAHSFIQKLSKKYDTMLSEKYKGGTRLSTGQWQKIAIARFFYRNAPLVIFDEPTAAIDAISEARIFNRIYNFFKHKTVIIISHRFSTVRNADRILVLAGGQIVEQGTHEELMKLGGKYAQSFNLQAKGYV